MASEPTSSTAPSSSSSPAPDATAPYPNPNAYAYPEPNQYPYATPGYYYPWVYMPPAPRLGTWALVSMICGAVSIATFQSVLAILAIIFGFIGLNEVKKSQGTVEGRGFAIAGIVTGFISIGLTLLVIALYILYFIFLLSALNTLPD
ncbi:MAG TPA: DUF4190 domain-containing protein [Ktedonobacterales bacterium]|nr:DUF4190 domain-containing protein [Ktedonobacterales bacterium]